MGPPTTITAARGRMKNRVCAAVIFMFAVIAPTDASADIEPALRTEFEVRESSLNDLMEILTQYANKEGFIVEDVGPHMPQGQQADILLNLKRQGSTEITVTNFLKQNQMLLGFYASKQDASRQL